MTKKPSRCRPNEIKWSNAVREQAGWKCEFPGCKKGPHGLHAHHVAPRSRRPDLKYDLSNGKALCFEHHSWVHDHPIEATEMGLLSDETYELAARVSHGGNE